MSNIAATVSSEEPQSAGWFDRLTSSARQHQWEEACINRYVFIVCASNKADVFSHAEGSTHNPKWRSDDLSELKGQYEIFTGSVIEDIAESLSFSQMASHWFYFFQNRYKGDYGLLRFALIQSYAEEFLDYLEEDKGLRIRGLRLNEGFARDVEAYIAGMLTERLALSIVDFPKKYRPAKFQPLPIGHVKYWMSLIDPAVKAKLIIWVGKKLERKFLNESQGRAHKIGKSSEIGDKFVESALKQMEKDWTRIETSSMRGLLKIFGRMLFPEIESYKRETDNLIAVWDDEND